MACHHDRPQVAVKRFALALREIDAHQAGGLFRDLCFPYVTALVDTGEWRMAAGIARQGHELAIVQAHAAAAAKLGAVRARLMALRGAGTEAKALLEDLPALDFAENRATHALVLRARSALTASLGDFEGTYHHLRSLFGRSGDPLHPVQASYAIVLLSYAAQRTGRAHEAATCVALLRAALGTDATPRQRAMLDHAEALTCEPDEAEGHFLRARDWLGTEPWPYDRALLHFGYGACLRRKRRLREARELLTVANGLLSQLGAVALAEEVAGELRAAGGGTESDVPPFLADLTPQQRQIVRMAAIGLQNPEIARRLMLSPHTVRSHLYRVFYKLGITDRRQLPGLFASHGVPL